MVNNFNTKEVSHLFPDMRVPKVLLPFQKNGLLVRKGPIWPKIGIFAQYWPFWPIWSYAQPKNNANEVPTWFSVTLCGHQNFCFLPKRLGFLVQKWPILAKNMHFG